MGGLVNVAVVFTDLVGSTALASRVGPEVAERLRVEHFSLLRGVVGRHGGREVKNLGDGLMVAFDRASAAVGAGVEMHQVLERRNRADAGEVLVIRVGVSVGEAESDDDGDLFGPPVVEAARLCAAAEDGQVLASEVVRALVGGRGGFEFRSLGVRELKGIPDPVAVCEVGWEPLPDEVDEASVVVPLPARLVPVAGVFAGRVAEVELFDGVWKDVAGGQRRAVVVAGEAGIGKTTLVSRFAGQVHAEGAVVVYGRCDEDLGVAYQPWIEALGHLVAHLPEPVLAAHVAACGGPLSRLVPELGRRIELASTSSSVDAESDRYLLFGAVVDLLVRAAGVAPTLVVLDDLHWADRSTVQLLRHVVSDPALAGVLVIATYRQTDVTAGHPLVEAIAALHRVEEVDFVDLAGLGDLELLGLLESIAGHELPEAGLVLRDALVAETDGNPFFTLEILRHLSESGMLRQDDEGRWATSVDLRETGLPVSVRQVVGQRVANLGEPVERVLRQAAVIGRDFDLDLLATLTDTDPDALLDLLDTAVEAAVVVNVEGDRFSFAHALIEHALYHDLVPARRARAHRRIAVALEARCGHDPGERVGELAHHWTAAVAPDDSQKALEWARRAGDHALEQLAPDEATRWYRTALDLLDGIGGSTRSLCEVMIALGTAERLAGDRAHRQRLIDAAHHARALDEPDLLVAAAVANNRGNVSRIGAMDAERVAVLELALDAVDPDDLRSRARLLAVLCAELSYTDDLTRPSALAEEALDLARRDGHGPTICDVLHLTYFTFDVPWRLDELDRRTREALELTGDDPVRRCRALEIRLYALMRKGDRVGGLACLDEALVIAERTGVPDLRRRALHQSALQALLDGDPIRAEQLAGQAVDHSPEADVEEAMAYYGIQLVGIRWHEGRMGEFTELIAGATTDAEANADPNARAYQASLAAAHAQAGALDEARPIFEELTADLDALRRDVAWSTTMVNLADTALVLHDADAAAELYERLAPFADQTSGISELTCEGSIAHRLGCLAALLGHTDDAIEHLTAALTFNRRLESPIHIAATAYELANLLRDRNPTTASELHAEAEQLKASCGLDAWPGITGRWSP